MAAIFWPLRDIKDGEQVESWIQIFQQLFLHVRIIEGFHAISENFFSRLGKRQNFKKIEQKQIYGLKMIFKKKKISTLLLLYK